MSCGKRGLITHCPFPRNLGTYQCDIKQQTSPSWNDSSLSPSLMWDNWSWCPQLFSFFTDMILAILIHILILLRKTPNQQKMMWKEISKTFLPYNVSPLLKDPCWQVFIRNICATPAKGTMNQISISMGSFIFGAHCTFWCLKCFFLCPIRVHHELSLSLSHIARICIWSTSQQQLQGLFPSMRNKKLLSRRKSICHLTVDCSSSELVLLYITCGSVGKSSTASPQQKISLNELSSQIFLIAWGWACEAVRSVCSLSSAFACPLGHVLPNILVHENRSG